MLPRWLVAASLLMPVSAAAQDPHAGHAAPASVSATPVAPTAPATPRDPSLPPNEDQAKGELSKSPRHGEYVDVKMADGTPIRTWVVYPERRNHAGVVVLVHEIFGLSDWLRAVADQLAREGFIAVAPDLVSGLGPGGGGTESAASRDDVVKLVHSLTPEMTRARLDAVFNWAAKEPAGNGHLATVGFCWGGGVSFASAARRPGLKAAVVYYGVSPDSAMLQEVAAPVLGLYGGDDARVTSTVPAARKALAARHMHYEVHVFEGAGHGFLRQQGDRDGANRNATRQAWPLTLKFLKRHLE
jgi:carboxymethylenebutenolidase